MVNYGVRISSNDGDALTQLDRDTVYSSKFSTLKIFMRGYISLTTDGGGSATKRIRHGLGYIPTYYVWRKDTASFSFLDATTYPNSFHPLPGTPTPWIPFQLNTFAFTTNDFLRLTISGAPNTTYHYLYYIFVDQGEDNQKAGIQTQSNYGMKVTRTGNDVDDASEQRVAISSEYKTLQYYPSMITKNAQMSLPSIAGDFFDQTPQEGTYVDFMHGLGYAPFFLAFAQAAGDDFQISIPDSTLINVTGGDYALTGWCDDQRIRITFYRKAEYGVVEYDTSPIITIKVFIFTENLEVQ